MRDSLTPLGIFGMLLSVFATFIAFTFVAPDDTAMIFRLIWIGLFFFSLSLWSFLSGEDF